jgi:hypothetical protein
MRLVIGGPTRDTVPASFAFDLARLYYHTREHGPWESVTMGFIQSTYVHVGREAVLQGAIDRQATHVLWLDTDMTFPPETAFWLAQHDKAIVGCNCVMRDPRLIFTAQAHGRRVETSANSHGLESVDTVGLAVMLMRVDVVAALERPWFRHGRNAVGGDVGEDVMFCRALRDAGHEIFIDHDLSKEIGHIGQHTFRADCAAIAV